MTLIKEIHLSICTDFTNTFQTWSTIW